MARRRKRRRRVQPSEEQRPQIDRGTTQTRHRLRESTIDRLIRQGRIDTDMERAAKEIDRVFTALTRRLGAKTSSWERVDSSNDETVPAALQEAYLKRYIPWTKECKGLSIIFDIIIGDHQLKPIDRKYKRSDGFARDILLNGLKCYARITVWGA